MLFHNHVATVTITFFQLSERKNRLPEKWYTEKIVPLLFENVPDYSKVLK